jgi:hypothetical protein
MTPSIIEEQLQERTEALQKAEPPDGDWYAPLHEAIIFILQVIRSKLRTDRFILYAVVALLLAVFFDIKIPVRGIAEKWMGGEIEVAAEEEPCDLLASTTPSP